MEENKTLVEQSKENESEKEWTIEEKIRILYLQFGRPEIKPAFKPIPSDFILTKRRK